MYKNNSESTPDHYEYRKTTPWLSELNCLYFMVRTFYGI